MFHSNKISLNQINICLNQIIFLQNKEINALIYGQKYNYFDLRQKFIWFEQILIWFKDILFESNKFCFIQTNHFFKSKKVVQTNYFLWFNRIFFSVHNQPFVHKACKNFNFSQQKKFAKYFAKFLQKFQQ